MSSTPHLKFACENIFANFIKGEELNNHNGQALLHSVLYSLLLQQRLSSALMLVEFLIRQTGTKKALTLAGQPQEIQVSNLELLQEQQVCNTLYNACLYVDCKPSNIVCVIYYKSS